MRHAAARTATTSRTGSTPKKRSQARTLASPPDLAYTFTVKERPPRLSGVFFCKRDVPDGTSRPQHWWQPFPKVNARNPISGVSNVSDSRLTCLSPQLKTHRE